MQLFIPYLWSMGALALIGSLHLIWELTFFDEWLDLLTGQSVLVFLCRRESHFNADRHADDGIDPIRPRPDFRDQLRTLQSVYT